MTNAQKRLLQYFVDIEQADMKFFRSLGLIELAKEDEEEMALGKPGAWVPRTQVQQCTCAGPLTMYYCLLRGWVVSSISRWLWGITGRGREALKKCT